MCVKIIIPYVIIMNNIQCNHPMPIIIIIITYIYPVTTARLKAMNTIIAYIGKKCGEDTHKCY